jgi:hypothetical protein
MNFISSCMTKQHLINDSWYTKNEWFSNSLTTRLKIYLTLSLTKDRHFLFPNCFRAIANLCLSLNTENVRLSWVKHLDATIEFSWFEVMHMCVCRTLGTTIRKIMTDNVLYPLKKRLWSDVSQMMSESGHGFDFVALKVWRSGDGYAV